MRYRTRVWKPFRKDSYYAEWKRASLAGVFQELRHDLRRCHERIWKGYCDYDTFSIDHWFLGLMPTMLEEFKDHLHGCPVDVDAPQHAVFLTEEEKVNDAMDEWKAILDRIIFLLKEADEETCIRKNPYEEEYERVKEEFETKYGSFGEKLMTEKEKDDAEHGRGIRAYFPGHVEEYKPVSDRYFEEERKLAHYRDECKDEALALFSKWFFALWD